MDVVTYKNQYTRSHYDRIGLIIPKGQKDRIKDIAQGLGVSVNEYIYMLFCNDVSSGDSKLLKSKQSIGAAELELLEKWQISKKYFDMIESMSCDKVEGYFIHLKEGYINDITGNRNIHCRTSHEVRKVIVKTHKK